MGVVEQLRGGQCELRHCDGVMGEVKSGGETNNVKDLYPLYTHLKRVVRLYTKGVTLWLEHRFCKSASRTFG